MTEVKNPEIKQGRILVVDDEFTNRELLYDILTENGYLVELAENGFQVFEQVKKFQPDLILLDIMMPDMTGYEVCEKLKASSDTDFIPVIFITALNSREDITNGLDVGATDFLTKPINSKDVLLRSRNSIYMKKLLDQQKENLQQLKELQKKNDELLHMIVHDMRNPLSGIVGYMDLLQNEPDLIDETMHDKMINAIAEQTYRLLEMVSSMLDINKIEKGRMKLEKSRVDLVELVPDALKIFNVNHKNIEIIFDNQMTNFIKTVDANKITRVIENLITNAMKFSDENDKLVIQLSSVNDKALLKFIDNGPGVPDEYKEKIFEKFGQLESEGKGQKYSTGLGLTFCKYVVEAHDGEIGVYDNQDGGSTFWFKI